MSSDSKLQYIMKYRGRTRRRDFSGFASVISQDCLLRLKHTRVFLFSHGFNWMSISNNSLSMVLYFSKSHKYAAHCCSNCFHIVDSLVPLEALANFLFLIKGFVYKRETNFPFRWSESLFHFLTVVWWGWLVSLSSLRRSWPEKIQPLRHCLGIVPLSWRPSYSAWSWFIFPALKPLVTLRVLLYAYMPRLLPLRL